MINHEASQRNVLPYLIGLGLINLAFLFGWMANGVLQTSGLQVNVGSAPTAAPSTEIQPVDRKLFNYINTAAVSAPGGVDTAPSTEIQPVDRKLFNYINKTVGSAPAGIELAPAMDTTDR